MAIEKALLIKLEKYCAYQERCHQELRNKAHNIGIPYHEVDMALLHLVQNNFLNEERFAELYARSKMNQKKWGPNKIAAELKKRNISNSLILSVIGQLSHNVILKNAEELIVKKIRTNHLKLDSYKNKQLIYRFLYTKGYSSDTITILLKKYF